MGTIGPAVSVEPAGQAGVWADLCGAGRIMACR